VDPDRQEFPAIATAELFADLLPQGILWVARQGHLRDLEAGDLAMAQGEVSDVLALVLAGDVRLRTSNDRQVVLGPGQTVGEMGVITGQPRSTSVSAGPAGARLFVLPAQAFEELLRRSRRFGRGLLAQLAERLAAQAG
jgi:CRP-like cAMP-binding protein